MTLYCHLFSSTTVPLYFALSYQRNLSVTMATKACKPEADEIHQLFMAIRVAPPTFRILWLLLVLVRLWCIVFLATTVRLYWFVSHPYMSYYAALLDPNAGSRFKIIGCVFGLVGLAHALKLVSVLFYSLRLGRMVLDTTQAAHRMQRNVATVASETLRMPRRRCFAAWWCCPRIRIATSKCLKRLASCLFGRRGFFGVESDFFHARFLAQELLE